VCVGGKRPPSPRDDSPRGLLARRDMYMCPDVRVLSYSLFSFHALPGGQRHTGPHFHFYGYCI